MEWVKINEREYAAFDNGSVLHFGLIYINRRKPKKLSNNKLYNSAMFDVIVDNFIPICYCNNFSKDFEDMKKYLFPYIRHHKFKINTLIFQDNIITLKNTRNDVYVINTKNRFQKRFIIEAEALLKLGNKYDMNNLLTIYLSDYYVKFEFATKSVLIPREDKILGGVL